MVQDVMFGITGTDDGERQRLIRTGLLTPFRGTSDTAREGLMNGALPSQPQATSLSTTMSEFNWLGVTSSSSSLSGAPAGKGEGPARKTKSTLSKRGSVADDGERQRLIHTGLLTPFGGTSDTAREGLMNGVLPSQPQATSTSSSMSEFDWLGVTSSSLSSSSSLSGAPAGKGKGPARKTKSTLSKRGSVATAVRKSDSNGRQIENHDTLQSETGPSIQHEAESRDSLYKPSSKEEEESSYYTDEELGGGDSHKRGKRKKRRIAQDFSSDSSDTGELMEEMRRRMRKRGARKRKGTGKTIDDGDEEMYRLRIRYDMILRLIPDS